jgi:hypothetical protein
MNFQIGDELFITFKQYKFLGTVYWFDENTKKYQIHMKSIPDTNEELHISVPLTGLKGYTFLKLNNKDIKEQYPEYFL